MKFSRLCLVDRKRKTTADMPRKTAQYRFLSLVIEQCDL